MRIIGIIFLFIASAPLNGQISQINYRLKNQLDSIYVLDQKYRELLYQCMDKNKRDSIAKDLGISSNEIDQYIFTKMTRTDTLNLAFIEKVIDQYGYPGTSLVGEETNAVAWYVIQHSSKIDKYFPLIKEAGQKKELSFTKVATMEDRLKMSRGEEQIYGTQGCGGCLKNGDKGNIIWPVMDPEHVNHRRKLAGFPNSIEEYAKELDIEYRIVKIDEVRKVYH